MRKEILARNITRRTQTYDRDVAIGYDPFNREGEDVLGSEEDMAQAEYDP